MSDLPGYLAYRVLSGLFGLLPARAAQALGRATGRGASHVAKRRLGLLKRHMRRVLGPDRTEEEITAAAREMFVSYGRYWAEVFWFRPRRKRWMLDHSTITGLDPVFAAKAEGRGIVFAVAHMGNWEVAGIVGESLDLPVLGVAENLPNRRITDWFVETRAAFGVEVIVAGGGRTMTKLARGLERGSVVALVAERDVTGHGVEVEFFGEKTTMPVGPAALALMTDSALFPIGTYFDGVGHRFEIHPELPIPDGGTRNERIAAATRELARAYEQIIRVQPTEWHLFQPNWPSDRDPGTDR